MTGKLARLKTNVSDKVAWLKSLAHTATPAPFVIADDGDDGWRVYNGGYRVATFTYDHEGDADLFGHARSNILKLLDIAELASMVFPETICTCSPLDTCVPCRLYDALEDWSQNVF